MDRDQFMSADEAKNYGLIDFVARPAAEAVLDDSAALEAFIKASDPAGTLNKLATADSMTKTQDVIRELPETKSSKDLTASFSGPQEPMLQYTGLLDVPLKRSQENASEQNPFDVVASTNASPPNTRERLEAAAMLGGDADDITITELKGMLVDLSEDPFALFIPWTEVLGKTALDLPETYTLNESAVGAVEAREETKTVTFESFNASDQTVATPTDETIPLFIHGPSVDDI